MIELWVKDFPFSIISLLKLNFSPPVFDTTYLCTIEFRADTGNNRKIVNFTYSRLYARPIKQCFTHYKLNFKWKHKSISAKSVLCILKIYINNYKLPVFRANLSKLKFWKLLSSPNVNPKNGAAYKKACIRDDHGNSGFRKLVEK